MNSVAKDAAAKNHGPSTLNLQQLDLDRKRGTRLDFSLIIIGLVIVFFYLLFTFPYGLPKHALA